MNALITFLISIQCHGELSCEKYLSSCTHQLMYRWRVAEYEDRAAQAKVAISICEKQYAQNEKWD